MERIAAIHARLAEPSTSAHVLVHDLTELGGKQPAIEVLKATRIGECTQPARTTCAGKTVKRLTTHADEQVRHAAVAVMNSWTQRIAKFAQRTPIDVRCVVYDVCLMCTHAQMFTRLRSVALKSTSFDNCTTAGRRQH
jgi:hypothetical protein